MQRIRYEDRSDVDRETREVILSKSSKKCARCGMKLDISTMTIDHFIPISKGGTNNIENLISLCYDCNQDKDNNVLHPYEYIKYLSDEAFKEIEMLYDGYCEDYRWYTPVNLTPEDKSIIQYPLMIKSMGNHRVSGNYERMQTGTAILKRLNYCDLDEAYDFVVKYMKKYGLDYSELKDVMSDNFSHGCIYSLSNTAGIIAIIPIKIEKIKVGDEEYYAYVINGMPVMYPKEQYYHALREALNYILGNLARLDPNNMITFTISYPAVDTFLKDLVDEYSYLLGQSDDGWERGYCQKIFVTRAEAKLARTDPYISKILSQDGFNKGLEDTSRTLERLYSLPTINKELKDFDVTKKKTVKEKEVARQYRKKQKVTTSVKKTNNKYKKKKEQIREKELKADINKYL